MVHFGDVIILVQICKYMYFVPHILHYVSFNVYIYVPVELILLLDSVKYLSFMEIDVYNTEYSRCIKNKLITKIICIAKRDD